MDPTFEIASMSEYYLSPDYKKQSDSAFIAYPSYNQTPYCFRSIYYNIRLDTWYWNTSVFKWQKDSLPEWTSLTDGGMLLDLSSKSMLDQEVKFKLIPTLEDYNYDQFSL